MRKLYLSFLTVSIILLSTVMTNAQFEMTYSADSYDQHDYSILERVDLDGYIMAGTLYEPKTGGQDTSDIHLISTDYDGNIQWHKRLYIDNGFMNETGFNINYAMDENYIITGKAEIDGVNYLHLIVIDGAGNVVNQRIYNVGDAYHTNGLSVVSCEEGYIVAGFVNSIAGGYTDTAEKYVLVMKVDIDLNVMWQKLFNSRNNADEDYDMADFALYLRNLDMYYIGGLINVNDAQGVTNQAALSLMLDNGGNIVWSNSFSTLNTDHTGGTDAVYDEENFLIHYLCYNYSSYGTVVCEIDALTGIINRNGVIYDGSITVLPNSIMFGENPDQLIISGFVFVTGTPIKAPSLIDFDISSYTTTYLSWYNNPFANYSSFESFFHFNASPISYTSETMIKTDLNYLVIGYRDDINGTIDLVLNETDFAFENDCEKDEYYAPANLTAEIEYLELEEIEERIATIEVEIVDTEIEIVEYPCFHKSAIANDNNGSVINFYPNPNNGMFTLELNNKDIISEVYITNVLNQVVCRVENIEQINNIDLTTQPNGMYFINIKSGNKIIVEKVMIK